MDVQGTIKVIDDTKEYGSNGFRKREMVLTTEEQYPQVLPIEFVQDKTSVLDTYNVGDKVKVSVNLRGREWVSPQGETKYFSSIQGWRIERVQANASSNDAAPVPPADQFEPANDFNEDEHDDLPF